MKVNPVVAVVTQKLKDTMNEESIANNKVLTRQLKGVQKCLKKPQRFSKEDDHLRALYEVEDTVERFPFQVARERKTLGFLMKKTFFFNSLKSCHRLKRKIKKIRNQISTSPEDVPATPSSTISSSLHSESDQWSEDSSRTSNSSTNTAETTEDEYHNHDDNFYYETHAPTQTSFSEVWPILEVPSTPSPKRGFLTKSFSTIPYRQEQMLQRSSFSYQEDELGVFGLHDDIQSLVKRLTQKLERNVSKFTDNVKNSVKQHTRKNEMFVPIVGEVGSGKTTLARAVYRNRKIKDHFEFHFWISVTEEYTTEMILRSVSKKVTQVKDNGAMSPNNQGKKSSLLNHLKGKRYLIVLDGVGSRGVLEDLIDAFPDENNGSKVIFTSCEVRKSRVMNINPHIMNPLKEKESWNMFLNKAGKEKEDDQIGLRLKGRILNICRGLPLNIVLIARLLSTKRTERWSSSITHNQCSDEVLTLCYDDLSIHSKLCLLYLALFPKDYDIPVRRLIRLWLAEGFVERRTQQFPEDLVQIYFKDLVDRSMIQITKLRSDNSPRRCRLVHALHDYLLPKAQNISLFCIHHKLEHFDDAEGPFGVRRIVQQMSITGDLATSTRASSNMERGKEKEATPSSSTRTLSCFCLSCKQHTEMATSHPIPSYLQQSQLQSSTSDPSLLRSYVSFNYQDNDKPAKEVGLLLDRIIHSHFPLLRVLDLEGVYKPHLPNNLGYLRNLRYLGLRWTSLESIPESVGELSNLETLDVKHTDVVTLPDSIWKLEQLHHLNLNNIRLAMPPRSSLTLLTLWGLVLDEKISVTEGLAKLCDLRELGIKFNLSKSQGELLDWIARLVDLQSLRLTSIDDMGRRPLKLVLKPLVNLKKLSHLNLYGNLERLLAPNEFPPTLKVLTLSFSQLINDPMETLEQLPNLIVLRLLCSSYTGKRMACHRGGFKKVEVLKLWMLEELEEWDVEEEAMESLKELEIRCCHKLNNIPCRIVQKQMCLDKLILTGMPDDFVARIKKRKSKGTSLTINPWNQLPRV